jgi:hypothetical protein
MLYLLDSNDPANPAIFRSVTSELYGGGPETRIRQEIILGIGGWRLLRALGLNPELLHLNEGHAAFAVLERAHSWMADHRRCGLSFRTLSYRGGNHDLGDNGDCGRAVFSNGHPRADSPTSSRFERSRNVPSR